MKNGRIHIAQRGSDARGRGRAAKRVQVMVVSLLVFSIAGCVSMALQRQREAWQQAGRILFECEEKRSAGELSNYLESVLCSNDRARQVIAESGYPYMDLVNLLYAYRLAAARRIDAGSLARDEAELQWAELMTRVVNDEQRRNYQA